MKENSKGFISHLYECAKLNMSATPGITRNVPEKRFTIAESRHPTTTEELLQFSGSIRRTLLKSLLFHRVAHSKPF